MPPIGQATPDDLNEALAHWEDLDAASLAQLTGDPTSATKLAALRRVEDWMSAGGLLDASGEGQAASGSMGDCPPAEDLFDFARSHSANTTSDMNEAVEAHLSHCAECSELIGSLASRPPSPLILVPGDENTSGEQSPEDVRIGLRPLGRKSTWPPILAAAGLAGLALIPTLRGLSPWAPTNTFPTHALLRGQDAAPLFPRGKLLAASPGVGVRYELPMIANAEAYRVDVYAHGPGAFELGDLVANLRGATHELSGERLAPGRYTWQAFVRIRGLESELGQEEFQVIEERVLAEEFATARGARDVGVQLELVHRLVEQGFESDARRLAQSMPESPERAEFLRGPGR